MTMPGRITNPRGRLWPIPLARYLHTSFLHRRGRLTLPPREERIARVCQTRLITGLGGRGKVEPPPFPLLPLLS